MDAPLSTEKRSLRQMSCGLVAVLVVFHSYWNAADVEEQVLRDKTKSKDDVFARDTRVVRNRQGWREKARGTAPGLRPK